MGGEKRIVGGGMKNKKVSCCKKCKYCYADTYCAVRDDYIDDDKRTACEDYFPKENCELYQRGFSIVEFDEEGHLKYSPDQLL